MPALHRATSWAPVGRRLKTFVAGNRGPDEALAPSPPRYGDLSGVGVDRRTAGMAVEEDLAGFSQD